MDDKNSNVSSLSLSAKCPIYPRINHQSILLGQEALIFGGTGPTREPLRSILRFNFENARIDPLYDVKCPSIEGFSLFSSASKVYLWGGFVENKPSNSLYFLNGQKVQELHQKGRIPHPRGFHCSAWVASRYLLIYGGFNESQIFNDWYIFDTQTNMWHTVDSNILLPKNTIFQLGWKNGRGFLVSSQSVQKNGQKKLICQKNEIFQVRITNFTNFQLRIDPIKVFSERVPPPRANPTLIFTDKKIILMGGQYLSTRKTDIFTDIWSFDIQSLCWTVLLRYSVATFGATPITYENKIYLFGGLKSAAQMSPFVQIITFKNNTSLQTHICSFCKSIYGIHETIKKTIQFPNPTLQVTIKENWDPTISISTSFLSKLAHSLQNPIQAFGLLIDNSLNMSASTIHIGINRVNGEECLADKPSYLFVGDNSRSFSSDELVRMMLSFRYRVEKSSADEAYEQQLKIRSQYGLNLKMACLRLGKSCLFVSKTIDGTTFIGYFSQSGNKCPDGQPSFNCIHYTLNNQGRASSALDQQIVCENMGHILKESEFANMAQFNTKIYIQGIYDLQVGQGDLIFCPPGISVNFYSLSDYISKLYLNPVPGREIQVQGKPVTCYDISVRFRHDRTNGDIDQIEKDVDIFNKSCLYQVETRGYTPRLVYIYHQNRLITTLCSQERMVCGFIEIPEQIEVDFFKSKIEKYYDEKKLQIYIQEKECRKKRLREIQSFNGFGNVRKMKPTCLDL